MCRRGKGGGVAAVVVFAAVVGAAAAKDSRPSAIGVEGGSVPPAGVVEAQERLPHYAPPPQPYGIGRAATAADIAAWNIDARWDGDGLPPGSGGVEAGAAAYDAKCAVCHGDFGQGEGRWPPLAGGFGSLKNQGGSHRPEKTVGSYWPYAPTLFDYIRRAMPYTAPQSLTNEETYALVAYLLHLNDLVGEDFVANKKSLSNFAMPNRDNFYLDARPDVAAVACMSNCLSPDDLALVESIRGVTPMEHLQAAAQTQQAEPAPPTASAAPAAPAAAKNYRQFCAVCHDSGLADAPRPNDAADWQARLAAAGGLDKLTQSAIVGKGGMPPKGGAMQLSDDDIAAIVALLIKGN